MAGQIRIGISGWRYAQWRGVFYPRGLPQRRELEFASRSLPSIEINGSFYGLQKPQSYARWHDETPDDFVFSLKAPRLITHLHRLRDIGGPMADFFASGVFELKDKLGPVLWQLPPSLRFEADLIESFLDALPHDTEAAQAIARRHGPAMRGRAALEIDQPRPMRHAVEVRHRSFIDKGFIALLRRHRVALVVADTAGHFPLLEDVCADFVYVRLHGGEKLYASGYDDRALDGWAARIRAWQGGGQPGDARLAAPSVPPPRRASRDVYCYFDNTANVHAPVDAVGLLERLGFKDDRRQALQELAAAAGG
jgi:uncharacterized protein YecE (DUF72 family)